MKVWPKNDAMRKLLKHPQGNVAFRQEGPVDWPDDSFTARRVADGDVLLEDPNAAQDQAAQSQPETVQQEQEKPVAEENTIAGTNNSTAKAERTRK